MRAYLIKWLVWALVNLINHDRVAYLVASVLPSDVIHYAMYLRFLNHREKFKLSHDDEEILTNFLVPDRYGQELRRKIEALNSAAYSASAELLN